MSDDPDEPVHPDDDVALESRREARAALPAVYVDTWSTVIWKGHMRIVLGEHVADDPHYRAAYVMELEDAKKLAQHILRRVQRQYDRDAARAKKDQDVEGSS